MPTYLLTYNPKRSHDWKWDDLAKDAEGTASGTPFEMQWSTGNRKNIQEGDRLFLLKQGKEPKGLIAAGRAIGDSDERARWDGKSGTAWYVDGLYDRILNPDLEALLSTATFTSGTLAKVHWATMASGILIPEDAATILEKKWAAHIGEVNSVTAEIMSDPDAEAFPEGRPYFLEFPTNSGQCLAVGRVMRSLVLDWSNILQ